MRVAFALLQRLGRMVLLLALVAGGTITLMRFAPGYFTDVREMDTRYAQGARSALEVEQARRGSIRAITTSMFGGWLHGDLGLSRQYDIPVAELIRPRLRVTALLLARGIICGWVLAFCVALPLSVTRSYTTLLGAPFTLLLAVPTGALATLCLLANRGGPVLVLTLLLAARDFKFLHRALQTAWHAPHLLYARSQGLRIYRLALVHVLPNIIPQIVALATLSVVTALSAIVPVEVIFDVPGLGQLAWSAAMNRDLPVLMAITLLMAFAVGCASIVTVRTRSLETA
jgi:peptide/nickel transport system permease protein